MTEADATTMQGDSKETAGLNGHAVLRQGHEQASAQRWTSVVDMKEIAGYAEFIERWPMYWMPRKEEVARILSVAKQMHEDRGAGKDEPLHILEIGSANAFLADLIVALAEENGLDVVYVIVDPEMETVEEAAMAHVGDKRFVFHAETAEQFVAKRSEGMLAYDLVICAWMPPEVDLTEDIRTMNGAAIVHVIETWGGTGTRDSYSGGATYRMDSGWIGHSLPELQHQEKDEVKEFCNAFLVQVRSDIGGGTLDLDPKRAGIETGEAYPWETELTRQQGELSPTIPLGGTDYRMDLSKLVDRMLERRERK